MHKERKYIEKKNKMYCEAYSLKKKKNFWYNKYFDNSVLFCTFKLTI